jgi:hypothetical protein
MSSPCTQVGAGRDREKQLQIEIGPGQKTKKIVLWADGSRRFWACCLPKYQGRSIIA